MQNQEAELFRWCSALYLHPLCCLPNSMHFNAKLWFDSTSFTFPNTVLFAGDVTSNTVCFAFEELCFDFLVIMSLLRSSWKVLNWSFLLSSSPHIGTRFDIHFLLSLLSKNTATSDSITKATRDVLGPAQFAMNITCKNWKWQLLRVRQLHSPYQNHFVIGHGHIRIRSQCGFLSVTTRC